MPITSTLNFPYRCGFRTRKSSGTVANDGKSQNTGLRARSQHTPFPVRRASTDDTRSYTCIDLLKAVPCTSDKRALDKTAAAQHVAFQILALLVLLRQGLK